MRKTLIGLGVVAALIVVATGLYQWFGTPALRPVTPIAEAQTKQASATPASKADALKVKPSDHVLGQADAPVTVIEYASLTCPHCAEFETEVLPKIKEAYIDTGKVRLVYRDFPLDQAALAASVVARCAGDDRYFAFVDLFFHRQMQWAAANDPVAALGNVAKLGGMSESQFQKCLKNEDLQKEVLAQRLAATQAFDVNATPTFIINGEKHAGVIPFDQFKSIVDPLLPADGGNGAGSTGK